MVCLPEGIEIFQGRGSRLWFPGGFQELPNDPAGPDNHCIGSSFRHPVGIFVGFLIGDAGQRLLRCAAHLKGLLTEKKSSCNQHGPYQEQRKQDKPNFCFHIPNHCPPKFIGSISIG